MATSAPFRAASCLLSFRTSPSLTVTEGIDKVKSRLKELLGLEPVSTLSLNPGVSMTIFATPGGSSNPTLTAVVKTYDSPDNLITITLEGAAPINTAAVEDSYNFYSGSEMKAVNNNSMDRLKELLTTDLATAIEKIPVLKRSSDVPLYFTSSDDRMFEYDFDSTVFSQQSKFQHVGIYHSRTLGNALFLDDLQNLAEADLAYTRGLMNWGVNDFAGKEILILGGGDGGLLHELLKEGPKFVTMVDIDEVVVNACRKYLRGACGDSLDQLKTDRYHVIIGDCLAFMESFLADGRKFDYVFNDLTDIPLSPEDSHVGKDLWGFVKKVLSLALPLVKDDGKYLNHAVATGCTAALTAYESVLSKLDPPVKWAKHSNWVPSFLEEWVFYEVEKK